MLSDRPVSPPCGMLRNAVTQFAVLVVPPGLLNTKQYSYVKCDEFLGKHLVSSWNGSGEVERLAVKVMLQ